MNQLAPATDCLLTILEAGTGYGKSTSVISFINRLFLPVFWYTIAGSDRAPTLFLAKLFTAFNQQGSKAGEEALHILDLPESTHQEAMIAFLNGIATHLEQDSIFVLDDFHRISDIEEIIEKINWMIDNLPPQLHVIIMTRHKLAFSFSHFFYDWFGPRWPLMFGLIFIISVLFFPYGIVGTWRLKRLQIKEGWARLIALLAVKKE